MTNFDSSKYKPCTYRITEGRVSTMSNHYRKTIHDYRSRQKTTSCPFCSADTRAAAIFEDDNVYVVPNLTKYDLWELHDVTDHLLVIPKRHVKSMAELGQAERLSVMEVCAQYELNSYNIYARGNGFVKRSVDHQHTHLIKVDNKRPRLAMFSRTPYFLFKI